MKILITGGSGFIGYNLYNYLKVGTDKRYSLLIPTRDELDITNLQQVEEYIYENCPDIIVHLAAQTDVMTSINDPLLDAKINIGGIINVVTVLKKKWSTVKRVIYGSTLAVYGETDNALETDLLFPVSPYAISKLSGEYYIRELDIDSIILRFSNVYGLVKFNQRESVINKFFSCVEEEKQPELYGNNSIRDYIYIDDAVHVLKMMLFNDYSGTFNVCTGIQTTTLSLWNIICDKKIEPLFLESRLNEHKLSVGCPDKLRKITGFKPMYSLVEGIMKMKG